MSKNIPSEEVILSLPNEGKEDFEINPFLGTAIQKNVITLYNNRFLLVCAKHLLNINKGSKSKGMYKKYSKMGVEKYPCLKDIDFEEHFVSCNIDICSYTEPLYLFFVILAVGENENYKSRKQSKGKRENESK
jgi:hypothetical protein